MKKTAIGLSLTIVVIMVVYMKGLNMTNFFESVNATTYKRDQDQSPVFTHEKKPQTNFGSDIPRSEYDEVMTKLRVIERNGSFNEAITEIDRVNLKWEKSGAENYGRLIYVALGDVLMSTRFIGHRDEVERIKTKYARSALNRGEFFTFTTQWQILGLLAMTSALKQQNPLSDENMRTDIMFWVRTLKRYETELNPTFDADDLPLIKVPPPSNVQFGAPGMAPENIKDEKARQEYLDAIKRNKQKAENYKSQYRLRRDGKMLLKDASRFFRTLYANIPEHIPELKKLLKDERLTDATIQSVLE